MSKISRRDFIKSSAVLGISAYGLGAVVNPKFGFTAQSIEKASDLAVVEGEDIRRIVRKAVDLVGGMTSYVQKGQTVVVKPNIAWDRTPEQAANTNPELVAEVIKMCFEAGVEKVKVFDRTCNQAKRCYLRSGIEKAANEAGADVTHVYDQKFESVEIPEGAILKNWEFYRDALEADVFINIPILKSHTASRATIGFKNIMGVIGGDRGKIHTDFDTKIVDLNTVIIPKLTIIDAYRIMVKNGPTGGNLADVKLAKTVVAGADRVAVDTMGAEIFGIKPDELGFLKIAYDRGFGEMDLSKLQVKKVKFEA